jgi:hypothetical protein
MASSITGYPAQPSRVCSSWVASFANRSPSSDTSSTQFPVAPVFPNTFTSLSQVNSVLSPSSINSGFAIPTLATPYVQEWTLGIEHALTRNISLNAAYIGSRGLKFLQRSDLNAGQPSGTDTYAIYNSAGVQTGSYSTPVYLNANNGNTTYNPGYSKILQIDNGGRLWYDGLIVELHQRENKFLTRQYCVHVFALRGSRAGNLLQQLLLQRPGRHLLQRRVEDQRQERLRV